MRKDTLAILGAYWWDSSSGEFIYLIAKDFETNGAFIPEMVGRRRQKFIDLSIKSQYPPPWPDHAVSIMR